MYESRGEGDREGRRKELKFNPTKKKGE